MIESDALTKICQAQICELKTHKNKTV